MQKSRKSRRWTAWDYVHAGCHFCVESSNPKLLSRVWPSCMVNDIEKFFRDAYRNLLCYIINIFFRWGETDKEVFHAHFECVVEEKMSAEINAI